jgi:hypothetical protein
MSICIVIIMKWQIFFCLIVQFQTLIYTKLVEPGFLMQNLYFFKNGKKIAFQLSFLVWRRARSTQIFSPRKLFSVVRVSSSQSKSVHRSGILFRRTSQNYSQWKATRGGQCRFRPESSRYNDGNFIEMKNKVLKIH